VSGNILFGFVEKIRELVCEVPQLVLQVRFAWWLRLRLGGASTAGALRSGNCRPLLLGRHELLLKQFQFPRDKDIGNHDTTRFLYSRWTRFTTCSALRGSAALRNIPRGVIGSVEALRDSSGAAHSVEPEANDGLEII